MESGSDQLGHICQNWLLHVNQWQVLSTPPVPSSSHSVPPFPSTISHSLNIVWQLHYAICICRRCMLKALITLAWLGGRMIWRSLVYSKGGCRIGIVVVILRWFCRGCGSGFSLCDMVLSIDHKAVAGCE